LIEVPLSGGADTRAVREKKLEHAAEFARIAEEHARIGEEHRDEDENHQFQYIILVRLLAKQTVLFSFKTEISQKPDRFTNS
jgi:hypothetical protein